MNNDAAIAKAEIPAVSVFFTIPPLCRELPYLALTTSPQGEGRFMRLALVYIWSWMARTFHARMVSEPRTSSIARCSLPQFQGYL
jgi:hypothetical protein